MTRHIEFIKLPEVKQITGIGTTKIYEMANQGLFPRQVKLGGRSVAWVKEEVLRWAQDQVSASRQAS